MVDLSSNGQGRAAGSVPWRFPLRWQITTIFASLILIALLTTSLYSVIQSRQLAEDASAGAYQNIRQNVVQQIDQISGSARGILDLMVFDDIVGAPDTATRLQRIGSLRAALDENARISAVYVGYDNGDFLILRRAEGNALRATLPVPGPVPANAAYIVQAIDHLPAGGRRVQAVFFDAALTEIGRVPDPAYDIDPRQRAWFSRAMVSDAVVETDPYVFYGTHEIGTTLARRSIDGQSVIGVDLTLKDITAALTALTPTQSTRLLLFTADRQIVASNRQDALAPVTTPMARVRLRTAFDLHDQQVWAPLAAGMAGQGQSYFAVHAEDRDWQVSVDRIAPIGGQTYYLGIAVPTDELLAGAARIQKTLIVVSAAILAIALIASWALALRVSEPLNLLADEARAIRDFDYTDTAPIRSRIVEVHELSAIMRSMRVTIRRFSEIGRALSTEADFPTLLDRLLAEMIEVAGATGGVIYLRDEKDEYLRRAFARTRSGSVSSDIPGAPPRIAIKDDPSIVGLIARQRTMIHRRAQRADLPAASAAVVAHLGLQGAEFESIAIPLLDRRGEVLGAILLLIEPEAGDTTLKDSAKRLLALISAIAGSASIAVENSHLILMQKQLIDGLIKLVAGSIDAKSPYTGGHCQRVPALAYMLAEAACRQTEGPFREFQLDAEAWESLRIASWLHDCGKITTPEYVVDKATKLETIYNRIHEIRTRFEVVKREFEISALRARLAGQDLTAAERAIAAFNAEIDTEYAFVAECNIGREAMPAELLERLEQIGQRRWLRTLDDRLGLSQEELRRIGDWPLPPLPIMERLLDDRPEHVVPRMPADRMAEDNPWNFRLHTPAHKYNFGELYNLGIGRGTLTDEERFIINDHIVQTIMMLESLPFPRHLASVPEIAGSHHERMDGEGYPRRLLAGDMSVLARIMAVADVFEALTADDRPYKKAKSLSESLRILGSFKKNRHLDPELVDLFLTSGVWKDYAERFLAAAQLDEPDIEAILAIRPGA